MKWRLWRISPCQHSSEQERAHGGFFSSRAGWVAIGFFIIIGALLFTEHRAHVLGALIWLPLLACPLMHMFMHHGGHGHGGHRNSASQAQPIQGKSVS
jgi:Protein of unknown function (DUF2933)